MHAKDPCIYLMHIRDACQSVLSYYALLHGPAVPDQVVLDAVCRRLEIIGEASRKISPEFRQQYPEIPWREMGGLRNVLIHDYEGTDPEVIWGIVANHIPRLLAAVATLLDAKASE
jgi:uncharacterized protein with HEPN domain